MRAATRGALVGLAALAGAALLPAALSTGDVRTMTGVWLFVAMASAWNLIGGFAGYASFGNVAFFGVGGYAVAVLMTKASWPFLPALVVAATVAALFAALVGIPVLRLRGHYFAIASLGVAEGMRELVINAPRLTGGGAGITIPALGPEASVHFPSPDGFYFAALAVAALAVVVSAAVAGSRFGYGLRAIALDEAAASAIGVRTTLFKVAAFSASAALTALAGGVFAFQQVTIYPERLFSVEITVLVVVMAVFGGAGTVAGPVVGALTLDLAAEFLRRQYPGTHLIVFGAVIVAAVVLLPEGVVRFSAEAWRERRIRVLDTVRAYRL